jgi:hypothetical protein
MDPIRAFRDLDDSARKRVLILGGVLGGLALLVIILGISRCERSPGPEAARLPADESQAISQVREAMFSVGTALAGETPAASVEEAVRRVSRDKAGGLTMSKVDGTPLKFDPKLDDWVKAKAGAPAGTVLVVGPAPASYHARNVVLIGIGRGGVPIEIVAGSEPDWLGSAVIGSKD